MSEMPKALLMAGRLREAERYTQGARVATQVAAAAELRRLHAANAELLEALKVALDASWNGPMPDYARDKARAAIAKAEGVKP